MWPDSSDGCGAVWLIITEFVIRRTVCVYYYKTVLLLTTSCRLKELRLLSVVILSDSETFLTFPPCEASPSTFTRTVWPPTFNPRPPNTHTRSTYCCACVSVTWLPFPPSVLHVNMPKHVASARWFCRPQQMRRVERSSNIDARSWRHTTAPHWGNFEHIWGFKFRYIYNRFSQLCDFLLLT